MTNTPNTGSDHEKKQDQAKPAAQPQQTQGTPGKPSEQPQQK
jgi:hypothetical protein